VLGVFGWGGVNGEFIPQSRHSNYVLNEGDSVELLSPIQGG